MSFDKIVGNDQIKKLFDSLIEENHIVQSYLFVGIEGIGKQLFAKEFAKKILCIDKEKNENCASCIKWNSNNHPDFIQIEKDGNSIKIDQIRDMQEKILQKPIISKRKIYIINDSETMTEEAQNCLLKTLEEPPEYAIIILITNNESGLLNTIKSRCMKVSFLPIEEENIKQFLKKQQIDISDELIKNCEGSIKKALYMKEQEEIYKQVDTILKNIEKDDLITIFNKSEILYKEKEMVQDILEYINVYLYNTKEIKKIKCIQYVEETKKRLLANANYDMSIDNLLIKLWEEINEKHSRCSI